MDWADLYGDFYENEDELIAEEYTFNPENALILLLDDYISGDPLEGSYNCKKGYRLVCERCGDMYYVKGQPKKHVLARLCKKCSATVRSRLYSLQRGRKSCPIDSLDYIFYKGSHHKKP